MNLAPPAPSVEPATADPAIRQDPATADRVQQSEQPSVAPPPVVDPAMAHPGAFYAPSNLQTTVPTSALSASGLRGDGGAVVEGYAAILRGAPEKNCLRQCLPWTRNERDYVTYGEVKRYFLIKGSSCFVYGEMNDPSPLYAIPLVDLVACQENPKALDRHSVTISPRPTTHTSPDEYVTVLLKYKADNSQAYQFTFDTSTSEDPAMVKRFLDAVQQTHSGPVTASIIRADQIAQQAKKYQPTL